MTVIQLKGLDKIKRKFEAIEPALKRGIFAATVHLKAKIAIYPDSTIANDPNQKRWYERGWGSKWRLKDGTVHGIQSSEALGRSWATKIERGGLRGVVGNDTSYGPYVQGEKTQARGLAAIGWKHTGTVAEEENATVTRFIQAEVDAELAK